MVLLLAPLLNAQSEVESKVVNSVTGAGIEGVQVEITLANSTAPSYRPSPMLTQLNASFLPASPQESAEGASIAELREGCPSVRSRPLYFLHK